MKHIFTPGDYPVIISDLKDSFAEWLAQRAYSRIFLLSDEQTDRHCRPVFLEKTGLPADTPGCVIPAGEIHKNIRTCEAVWQAMFDAQLDRKALVINLGGGVIGDLGGFCAATYKRGVDFVQVPTTLLSATDASVGGKLGIDFQGVKNAVGVFRNPAAVFVDPVFFDTLSDRELKSGFAEVIKHALIGDPALWQTIQEIQSLRETDWMRILPPSIAVKVRVVTEDPLEKGLRAILNYGHTIGHAIESYFLETERPLTHGEAIAEGMIYESRLAADPRLPETAALIRRFFSPVDLPKGAFASLWSIMQQDKKNAGATVRVALPGGRPYDMQTLEPSAAEVAAVLAL